MQASELQKYLVKILANPNVDVVRYDYNRILEVKPHGVSKGLAATAILEELFQMHNEKLKNSRPPSPALGGIDEASEFGSGGGLGGGRSNRGSHSNLSTLASPTSPSSGHSRSSSSSVFQPTSASALPPFLFCVGDDRSDEDMFLSVQNKDYLEGKLRAPAHGQFAHQHSHPLIGGLLPSQDTALKRSMSAASSGKSNRDRAAATQARVAGDIDEKTARERRKTRIADPFTFTVCVGMKPSNAHYYLHDDEEVVRLLSALGTSSQRMAQTRAADNKALGVGVGVGPGGSPTITGGLGGSKAFGSMPSVTVARPGAFYLRPADIPTSPPVSGSGSCFGSGSTAATQANYALQQATLSMRGKAKSLPTAHHRSASASASDESVSEEEPDSEDEEEEFRRKKQSTRTMGGGGLRRAL
jgi:hypothetical protein